MHAAGVGSCARTPVVASEGTAALPASCTVANAGRPFLTATFVSGWQVMVYSPRLTEEWRKQEKGHRYCEFFYDNSAAWVKAVHMVPWSEPPAGATEVCAPKSSELDIVLTPDRTMSPGRTSLTRDIVCMPCMCSKPGDQGG